MGCLTPISLFTVIIETSTVSGRSAFSSSWNIFINQSSNPVGSKKKIKKLKENKNQGQKMIKFDLKIYNSIFLYW